MNRIRECRQNKKLTLKQLSEELAKHDFKISADALGKYERSEREPKLETWIKLADFFNVSIPYIQGIQNSPEPNKKVNLNSMIHYVTEAHKSQLLNSKQTQKDLLTSLFNLLLSDKDKELYKKYFQLMLQSNNQNILISDLSYLFRLFLKAHYSDSEIAKEIYKEDWGTVLTSTYLAEQGKLKLIHKSSSITDDKADKSSKK